MQGLKSLLVELHWKGRNLTAAEDYRVLAPLLAVGHVDSFVVHARCVLNYTGSWEEREWRERPFEIFCLDKEGGALVPFVTRDVPVIE